ncbi:MAG: membrane protein insertion efficiency factor YidD, partial [Burkholderiales bacterium]
MRLAIFGDLLDIEQPPPPGTLLDDTPPGVRWRPAHWLLIENGRIAAIQTEAPDASWLRDERPGQLILPGFIDTHVHAPQLDVIASYGTELLDWLERYTFPAETAWAEPEVAAAGSRLFLDQLLAHGTTSALVFPTVHKTSVDALFGAALDRGMRLITGKCLMDRHAPDGLRDTVQSSERDTLDLLAAWQGKSRLAYAHTVRFAPTSTDAQLTLAGRLHAQFPSSYVQTHVAENRAEVEWVRALFPQARSYLDVYEQHGLLTAHTTLALSLIHADQRRISPHHGFAGAHRVHLGGPSCSSVGARLIRRFGLRKGLPVLRLRLQRCGDGHRLHHPR